MLSRTPTTGRMERMTVQKKALLYTSLIISLLILVETPQKMVAFTSLIKFIRPRDVDLSGDGIVNEKDFYTVVAHFGLYPNHAKWNPKADFNDDHSVNILDVIVAADMFGKTHALTHVVAYVEWFSDEDAEFAASNFDIVITGFKTASTIGKIKALNPTIIILGYRSIMSMHTYYDDWPEADAHEDWFLHDVSGNRIRAVSGGLAGWYGMDVGNPGWREHFANYVKSMLETYPDVDGIFADNAWNSFRYAVWNVPKEQLPADIGSRWHNDMLAMISFVKKTIGNKLLIVNTDNNDDYVDACDGKMEEHFVHKTFWWSLDKSHSEWYDWEGKVESLKNINQRGKYYLAHSGTIIPENPTEADLDKIHDIVIYCFASYLLGVNGEKAIFGFNNIHSKDGSRGYYSAFDVSLGSPVSEYYLINSTYTRDFSDGKVLVNPTNASHTIFLDENYRTLNGEKVSIVALPAHRALILLRI